MYFPFLQNRQSENLCIRHLCDENKLTNTIPIINTIYTGDNTDWTDNESIDKFIRNKFKVLIEKLTYTENKFILVLDSSMSASGITIEQLYSKLETYSSENIDIRDYCIFGIYDTDISIISNEFFDNKEIAILHMNRIVSITRNASYNILLNEHLLLEFVNQNLENKVIVTNAFNKRDSNRSYTNDDLFFNHALTYTQSGFIGFGDYTILSKEFLSGGGANMSTITVAIHLSYFNDTNIYIRHYICTPEEEGNFAARVNCAIRQLRNEQNMYYQSYGLGELVGLNGTNLMVLKKLTMAHHIELMNNY